MRSFPLLLLVACGGSSEPSPDALAPTQVSNLELFDARATEMSLRWTPGSADSGRYWLAYAKGTTPPATCAPTADVTGAMTTVSGLAPDTTYAFRLCPVDDRAGTLTIDPGITVLGSTLQLAPGEPSGVTMQQIAPGTFEVTWVPGVGAASYVVAHAEGTVAPASCASGQDTTSPILHLAGLATNKRYAVRVCAKNANPTPDVSTGVTAVAFMHSPLAPNPAISLAARDAEWMRLTWSAPADSKVAFGTSAPPAGCPTSTTTPRPSIVLANLTPATTYFIRVCPSNGDSEPLYSDGSVVMMNTVARIEPRVNGLSCTQGGSLNANWTGTGPALSYRFTKADVAVATSAPACTSATVQLPQVTTTASGFQTSSFGGQANERFHLRICFARNDNTFDQGQATIVTMPQIIGGQFIPGFCDPQENLVRPVVSLMAGSPMNGTINVFGTCNVIGSAIRLGGDVMGGGTCPSTNQWVITATIVTPGPGPISIAAYGLNDARYQGPTVFTQAIVP